MKTTLFTTVAAFAGLVLANPIAYTGEALRSSIIEERQGDGTQNYGQKVGACQQLKRQFPKLVAYPNAPLYRFEQDRMCPACTCP